MAPGRSPTLISVSTLASTSPNTNTTINRPHHPRFHDGNHDTSKGPSMSHKTTKHNGADFLSVTMQQREMIIDRITALEAELAHKKKLLSHSDAMFALAEPKPKPKRRLLKQRARKTRTMIGTDADILAAVKNLGKKATTPALAKH